MGDRTAISWTDATWNPVVGCTPAGVGCVNCYASELHERRRKAKLAGAKLPEQYARPFSEVQLFLERLPIPMRWEDPRKVFLCSTGDLFHPDVPDAFVAKVFGMMAGTPRHTFQVLTKRPHRAADLLSLRIGDRYPLPNVWLGASASKQTEVDRNIAELLECPVAIRFLSLEPLVEGIDLGEIGLVDGYGYGIDWIVVGSESGPKRRPCWIEWVRSIVQQCAAAGVACFVKQIDLDGRLSRDPAKWPADLRVQQFPK